MAVQHILGDRICTDVCSIQRWPDAIYRPAPGKYLVIATTAVLDLLKLHDRTGPHAGFAHPFAVADDFGNLVGVPQ